jgi:hypothetical protein
MSPKDQFAVSMGAMAMRFISIGIVSILASTVGKNPRT